MYTLVLKRRLNIGLFETHPYPLVVFPCRSGLGQMLQMPAAARDEK
jgi:hypothetical protein